MILANRKIHQRKDLPRIERKQPLLELFELARGIDTTHERADRRARHRANLIATRGQLLNRTDIGKTTRSATRQCQ